VLLQGFSFAVVACLFFLPKSAGTLPTYFFVLKYGMKYVLHGIKPKKDPSIETLDYSTNTFYQLPSRWLPACFLLWHSNVAIACATDDHFHTSCSGRTKDHTLMIIATIYSAAVLCTRLIFWILSIIRRNKKRSKHIILLPKNGEK
jgi:hypothetical protein